MSALLRLDSAPHVTSRDTMSIPILRGRNCLAAVTFFALSLAVFAPSGSCAPVDDTCGEGRTKYCLPNHEDCTCAPKCKSSYDCIVNYDLCVNGKCAGCQSGSSEICTCLSDVCLPENWEEGDKVELVEKQR
jgi:hypothetical protein